MKRLKLIKHLNQNGCYLLREGKRHSVFINPGTGRISTIPRHPDIKQFTTKKICKDLDITIPKTK